LASLRHRGSHLFLHSSLSLAEAPPEVVSLVLPNLSQAGVVAEDGRGLLGTLGLLLRSIHHPSLYTGRHLLGFPVSPLDGADQELVSTPQEGCEYPETAATMVAQHNSTEQDCEHQPAYAHKKEHQNYNHTDWAQEPVERNK
jgi:hypothetical protein